MLLSMTGFGSAEGSYEGRTYNIEIRALNGKTSDVRLRVPTYFKAKEVVLRKMILSKLVRGKIDVTISVSSDEGDLDYTLNTKLVESYYRQLKSIADQFKLDHQDFLQTIIRIPNVIQPSDEKILEAEWQFIVDLSDRAIEDLNSFRSTEGASIFDDLSNHVTEIESLQKQIVPHDEMRKKELYDRFNKLMNEFVTGDSLDQNRLEQEVVYYLEKLDIHEEQVRLAQHCVFFKKEINVDRPDHGKKLAFIAQEMGREINTLGSKAQYSPIQQIVVRMKVKLDQIKEQLANVV